MPKKNKVVFWWIRRDIRLDDNATLFHALTCARVVIPLFIFDENITAHLPKNDARINFIYDRLEKIHQRLCGFGSGLLVKKGTPFVIWKNLIANYDIEAVYFGRDYEPYARKRDREIYELLTAKNIGCHSFKDHVIFERYDILKKDNTPYTIYTPYKNKWLEKLNAAPPLKLYQSDSMFQRFSKQHRDFPSLEFLGFKKSIVKVKPTNFSELKNYDKTRDFPALNTTSYLSPHLRFGTVSVRKIVNNALKTNVVFLSELIWREFFMQILFHFPAVEKNCFKPAYEKIHWRNDRTDFEKWCNGQTGYPLVDAGMRELNATGYMHNRVRMVTASFLCKHLLIDWRWGERYFAEKLLDFELASNNGNWQWAAGTGCDAAPYFRVFNPTTQLKKFDADLKYTRKWVKNIDKLSYPTQMIAHHFARIRAIETYKKALQKN